MKRVLACVIIFAFMLAGCGNDLPSDMYALPEMPETHRALIETVDSVRGGGYEFSEPRSGFNRQPLQLMDLDGDGEEEGVAFLRDVADTYKTFMYVFEKSKHGFNLFDIIEGTENDIYTVSYSDILGENGYEIIVEWGEGDGNRSVTVYNRADEGMECLLDIAAAQYSVADIDGDAKNEFLAVIQDDELCYADIYCAEDDLLIKNSTIRLSDGGGELLRVKSALYNTAKTGVFIEREKNSGILTEIVAHNGEEFINLIPGGSFCDAHALCADVDGDGTVELPHKSESKITGANGSYLWNSVNADGKLSISAFTYHAFTENWYVTLPVSWSSTVHAKRSRRSSSETQISFFTRELIEGDGEQYLEAPLFRIFVLTGENRAAAAAEEGRIIISEREDTVFAAEIISESYLATAINEEFIKEIFKARESEWASDILFA